MLDKMNKEKKLLFSITKDDFTWQTFRAGGKGGQNQNKVESGVRCIHKASGARGEARDSRDQLRNRRSAFERCVNTPVFKAWHKMEIARRLGQLQNLDEVVDKMMQSQNLKIEYY